jgi:hypothetical protein
LCVLFAFRLTDEALGIDAEITRPATVWMLEQLQDKVEVASVLTADVDEDGEEMSFDFRVLAVDCAISDD